MTAAAQKPWIKQPSGPIAPDVGQRGTRCPQGSLRCPFGQIDRIDFGVLASVTCGGQAFRRHENLGAPAMGTGVAFP